MFILLSRSSAAFTLPEVATVWPVALVKAQVAEEGIGALSLKPPIRTFWIVKYLPEVTLALSCTQG
ncbi:MAG: hypothetical protein BWY83_00528 [bacterium ADurb.Bin478]|nr:MAG: hypothetical protein BWY83_00528 [bacterium ADurb.Bin478]